MVDVPNPRAILSAPSRADFNGRTAVFLDRVL